MMTTSEHRVKTLLWWAAFPAICAVFYGKYLIGYLPVGADNALMFCPFFSIRWEGGLPLWNPYTLAGTSFHDNLQTELLYPLRWPFFFLRDWRAYFGVFNWLHYQVSFAGMGLFLRGMGLSRLPVFAGAMLFACGGHMAGRIINPTIFYACAWLPLLLYGAAGDGRRRGWATTLAMTMILTLGSPHLMFYGAIGYALAAFFLGERPAFFRKNAKALFFWAIRHAGHFGWAFLFAAPTLTTGVLRARNSIRSLTDTAHNLGDSTHPFEFPFLFLGGTSAFPYPEYIDRSCYIGGAAVFLVLSAVFRRGVWKDRRFLFGWCLLGAGLFLSFGRYVGLQYIMPWIPGFRDLMGPSRALALAACGASVLAAFGLEKLPKSPSRLFCATPFLAAAFFLAMAGIRLWNLPLQEETGGPPFLLSWLRAWIVAPECLSRTRFFWLDAGIGFLLAGLCMTPARRNPHLPGVLLTLVIFFQLWHFSPRVFPPVEKAAFFDPSPQASFLMARRDSDPARPFRIAGFDPLRPHETGFNDWRKMEFLMPNLATLYGLEDICGFDPLIPLDYLRLFTRTAGRAPIDDPIRSLNLGWPDERLFQILGVRYLIGHPYERRVTHLPQTLTTEQPVHQVAEWEDEGTTRPLTQWIFLSLADSLRILPRGSVVARLEIEAEEGNFSFPVRLDIETFHARAVNRPSWQDNANMRDNIQSLWDTPVPMPSLHYRLKMAHYRGRVVFDRPLTVQRVTWHLENHYALFRIAMQGCRLQGPEAQDDPWLRVWGAENGTAPIYENLRASSWCFVTTEYESAASSRPGEVQISEADFLGIRTDGEAESVERTAEIIERRPGFLRVRVQTPDAGLLVFREQWHTGWQARFSSGGAAPVRRVQELFCGVEVPAGDSEVELLFRPRLFLFLLAMSVLSLMGFLAVSFWRVFGPLARERKARALQGMSGAP